MTHIYVLPQRPCYRWYKHVVRNTSLGVLPKYLFLTQQFVSAFRDDFDEPLGFATYVTHTHLRAIELTRLRSVYTGAADAILAYMIKMCYEQSTTSIEVSANSTASADFFSMRGFTKQGSADSFGLMPFRLYLDE